MVELRRSTAQDGDIQDVRLVITPVEATNPSSPSSSTTLDSVDVDVAISHAVDGKIIFSQTMVERGGEFLQQTELQQLVDGAFEGEAMDRYTSLLRVSADDPSLRSVKRVYKGWGEALDIPPATEAESENEGESENEDVGNGFEWNVFWIAIVAGGGAGLIGICLAAGCLCRRSYNRAGMNRDILQAKSTATDKSSPSGKISPRERDDTMEPTGHDEESPEESSVEDEDDASRAGRYPAASEVTSVYSYIEDHTLGDDQSYSVAPSMMYGMSHIVGDDQSLVSRMWSVADGFTDPMPNEREAPAVYVSTPVSSGKGLSFPYGEDDDVSMVSADGNKDQRVDTDSDIEDGVDGDDDEEERPQPLPDSSPYDKVDYSTNDFTKDDGSMLSDMESVDARLPFTQRLEAASKTSADTPTGGSVKKLRAKYENNINNKEIMESSMDSSDDDSSLFLGPNIGRYSKPQPTGSILSLSSSDKLNASADNEFRIGPLNRGTKVLTDKEKKHLGLSGAREQSSMSEDESSLALPPMYLSPEENKNNISVSTMGSAGIGGNYPIASMASF